MTLKQALSLHYTLWGVSWWSSPPGNRLVVDLPTLGEPWLVVGESADYCDNTVEIDQKDYSGDWR